MSIESMITDEQKQRVNWAFVIKATERDVMVLNRHTSLALLFAHIDVPAENADQQALSDSISSCLPDLNSDLRIEHTVAAIDTVAEVISRGVAA